MNGPQDLKQQIVLYGCLNWGSGHVARSIPILKELSKNGNELFVRCTKEQKAIFVQYQVDANFLIHEGFQFRFKGDGNFTREMGRNAWNFSKWMKQEHRETESQVKQHGISVVLSDHCYGLRSNSVPSIFITHQVFLPPKSGWLAQRIHRKWMSKFNCIWILDDARKRLAGELSKSIENSTYIGFYSRFSSMEISVIPSKVVGIVSGPEPYAEQLFHLILEKYGNQNLTVISSKSYGALPNNIRLISDWKTADQEIASAETIVSRNGYSTLMDLEFLKKKVILIPTTGQLEQEYLATLK